jgi:hypothetical protein
MEIELPSNESEASPPAQEKDIGHDSPAVCRPTQAWTMTGYPIVDRKYLELSTGTLKEIQDDERVTLGPPIVDVFWQNMTAGDAGLFHGFHGKFDGTVTEYLIRLAEVLKRGSCLIFSLNVTQYSVTVITQTELSTDEMFNLLFECRVVGQN